MKNAWYVAAWDHEITRELQQIMVLGEKICVFRSEAGELVGLEDACPHRKLPLSKGRIKKTDNGVIVHRWMMDHEPAPFYKKVVEFEGNCDRLQHYEVRYPSHALIKAVFTPAGTGGADGLLHENTFIMDSYNFRTPTNEGRTRYYWFQLRNIRPDDAALSQMMSEDVQHAFEEDRDVLNEVQKGMANKTSPHIDLPIDGGQLRFRRQLQAMINEEQQVDAQMAK